MKSGSFIVGTVALGLTIFLGQYNASAAKGGTSILHLTVDVPMSASEVDADAQGSVSADTKIQGGAEKQSLGIAVSNLDPSTTYHLRAKIGDDPNLVQIVDFDTDSNGAAKLSYSKKSQGNGGNSLPVGLDPVSGIRELDVVNAGDLTVLTADFTSPDKLQYLIKRSMDNDGEDSDAAASLRIKSNGTSDDQLQIKATGLDPSATYYLAINDNISDTLTSDSKGKLNVNSLPGDSPDVLDITELALWNSTSNSVLSTSLP